MDLSCASKQAKSTEDQSRRFLNPHVWIKTQADLSMPEIANRHRNPQFAAPGLRTGGVVHPCAKDAQFKLANAPLHTQEEPIIRPARIIDAVEVDDSGLYKAAELKEMVPIPTVPGQAGCVEAEDGSHIARAEPRDELLESRSGHRAACRAAKVVVDDLHFPKSASSGLVDKVVLPPLALKVDLDLGLSGLADVYDGLPLKERRGKDLTVHHRLPPRTRHRPLPSAGEPGSRSLRPVPEH